MLLSFFASVFNRDLLFYEKNCDTFQTIHLFQLLGTLFYPIQLFLVYFPLAFQLHLIVFLLGV